VEQGDVIRFALDVLDRLQLRYAVVGSFASIAYGEPRYTHDIDILVDLTPTHVGQFCEAFPAPDRYVSEPSISDAIRQRRQFNVIHTTSANKIDFMIPRNSAWGRQELERRQEFDLLIGRSAFAVHPEDVILGKLLYYREGGSDRHLRDVATILQISSGRIDRDNVARWAADLGVLDIWQTILERFEADLPPSPDTSL
jgi:hypothetical protein